MFSGFTPIAYAITAANMAFCTLCSALPSIVAGMRWVQRSGRCVPWS